MLTAILVLGLLGLALGAGLAVASQKFAVEKDPRMGDIMESLPGANCGACGFPGCSGYADAIVKGAPVNKCTVGGARVSGLLAEIMGMSQQEEPVKTVARLRCAGTYLVAPRSAEYKGLADCRAASLHAGGDKGCGFGCLGYGNCERACPFGAIGMGEDGLPQVDEELCKACAKCVAACPKNLFHIVRQDKPVRVACFSNDRGPEVKKVCSVGCIGCSLCVRECQFDAIKVVNYLAAIDPEKCTNCGLCAKKCPTKAIVGVSE